MLKRTRELIPPYVLETCVVCVICYLNNDDTTCFKLCDDTKDKKNIYGYANK